MAWVRRVLVGLLALGVLAAAGFWGGSEWLIRRSWPKPELPAAAPAVSLERAERLTYVLGCKGCHAENLQGELFWDDPGIGRGYASNLTLTAASWSDSDLERAIRFGVRPDGSSLWGMPSFGFTHLSPADMAGLINYLKSRAPKGKKTPSMTFEPLARWEIVTGVWKSSAAEIGDVRRPLDLGPALSEGRYLAEVACGECHGGDLKGGPGGKPPDLSIVLAYSPAEFSTLMRTGKVPGGGEVRLMSGVARFRFSRFSDGEVDALYRYLVARSEAGS